MALTDEQVSELIGLPSQHIHGLVVAKVRECIWKIESQLNVEIKKPSIKYDLQGRTAGQAVYHKATSTTTMRLNLAALNNPEFRDYMINQTIPHEMAHIAEFQLYGDAGHGFRWSHLCRILGIEPHRTHSLPLKRARKTTKYKYRCNCSIHWLGKNRHSKIQMGEKNFRCNHCGGRLHFDNETMERS